jgi:hypothetical protein
MSPFTLYDVSQELSASAFVIWFAIYKFGLDSVARNLFYGKTRCGAKNVAIFNKNRRCITPDSERPSFFAISLSGAVPKSLSSCAVQRREGTARFMIRR